MPKFSANLSMLFTDQPFLDRFAAARDAGFSVVEFQFPYDEASPQDIRDTMQAAELELALFNLPAGDWAAGDRGIAAIFDRRDEFRAGLDRAIEYATVLRPRFLNCLAGVAPDDPTSDLAILQNLRIASEELADNELNLTLEPVNDLDVPGFAVPTVRSAIDVIEELGFDNLSLQLDVYHATRMGEDPVAIINQHGASIGHIQVADDPGRHEPGSGDIDFPRIFDAIDRSGYRGVVGLEFVPTIDTDTSLRAMSEKGLLR